MNYGTGRCSGFWPRFVAVPHHRCTGLVPAAVWLVWLLAFALMTSGMLRLDRCRLSTVLAAQIVAGLLFVITPTMPTADAYAYHVYGAMLGQTNPWHPGAISSHRPAIVTGLSIWGNPPMPSPYGPLFLIYEHVLIGAFPGLSADGLIIVERACSLLAAVAITVLLRGPRVAWWALHPLVLFEFAVCAHCDVFMLALIALSIRLRSSILAGIAIGCSAMIKIVAAGAVVFRPATLATAFASAATMPPSCAYPSFMRSTCRSTTRWQWLPSSPRR